MRFLIDTHVHSVASGHAYSTVQEIAREARRAGLKLVALTDHGPAMEGAPCVYHFWNLKVIPDAIGSVRILKGAELNIVDYDGALDLPEPILSGLEFALAGFHHICLAPRDAARNTETLLRALENPHVDAISHPNNPQVPVDLEGFVRGCAERNRLVELNQNSLTAGGEAAARCVLLARCCVRLGVRVLCGSDAHIAFAVGRFEPMGRLFREIGMPEELVMNASMKRFKSYLAERAERTCGWVKAQEVDA